MDMDHHFANNMILTSDQSQSPVKQNFLWPLFAPNHTPPTALDLQSDPSFSTSVTPSPRLFSNQVGSNHKDLYCIAREIMAGIAVASQIRRQSLKWLLDGFPFATTPPKKSSAVGGYVTFSPFGRLLGIFECLDPFSH